MSEWSVHREETGVFLRGARVEISRWAPINPLFLHYSVRVYNIPVLDMAPYLLCGNLIEHKLIQEYALIKHSITARFVI